MAGYPYSGKSLVVDKIVESIPMDVIVVSPKDFRDEQQYATMDEDGKREVNIAAWSSSLDALWDLMHQYDDSEIIIYDTACASYSKMRPYFDEAKRLKHTIVYLFVHAPLTICKRRAGDDWLPKKVIDLYTVRFKGHVQDFANMSDFHIVIKNNTDRAPDVSKVTKILVEHNDRVYEPIR